MQPNVTGTVAIANGGTGKSTQATAITALTGAQTNKFIWEVTVQNAALSALEAADLTGTLPALDGGNLTNLTAAKYRRNNYRQCSKR